MKQLTLKIGSIAFLAIGPLACSELRSASHSTDAINSMAIVSPDCTGSLKLEKGPRGMMQVTMRNNYLKGEQQILGKAFVADKDLPVNPYVVLGEAPRSKDDQMKMNKLSLTNFGSTIDVSLGSMPETTDTSKLSKSVKGSTLRRIQHASTERSNAQSAVTVSLQQDPRLPDGYYMGGFTQAIGSLGLIETEGQASTNGGVSDYRSFIIDAGQKGTMAINIPGNPEPVGKDYKNGLKADAKGLAIEIAPDTNKPTTGLENALIFVQLQERKEKPTWQATCVAQDTQALDDKQQPTNRVLTIPMAWKDSDQKDQKVEGSFNLTVVRSQLRQSPIPSDDPKADGGVMYIDARYAYTTFGSAPKAGGGAGGGGGD